MELSTCLNMIAYQGVYPEVNDSIDDVKDKYGDDDDDDEDDDDYDGA